MAGLKETTARLAAYQRRFEKLRGSAGIMGSHSPTRLTEVTDFGANPGNLRMLKYVPADLPNPAPLVVVLHGCTQNAAAYDTGSGWSELAERFGFAVLFPEQQPGNNPNVCFNWFQPQDTTRGSGEAASVRTMVDAMVRSHGLDRRRVFVTGLSAGGAMASILLATYPEAFAGGAIIAGLPYGVAGNVQEALEAMYQGRSRSPAEWGDAVRRASKHKGPWPRVSIWHGSADTTVLPLNAGEIEKQWTNVHGLTVNAGLADRLHGHARRVWRDASGTPLVESVTVAGMGHGTPVGTKSGEEACGKPGPHMLEAGISSSYHIADFWGLVDQAEPVKSPRSSREQDAAHAARIVPLPSPSEQPPRQAARKRPKPNDAVGKPFTNVDPKEVIVKALRAARLLKP